MALSAVAVNHAKARDKQYKLTDGRGLYLLVTPKGHRYWRFKYRFRGRERNLALGVYPDVSLALARAKRDAARKILREREDPAAHRKQEVMEATARERQQETLNLVADEWLERLEKEGRSGSTMWKLRWLLNFARPSLGERPIAQITAPELLKVLRKVEARGHYETAGRLRSTFGTIFRYAIATGRAQRDVASDLRGALITPKTTHRAAIIEPRRVGALLRAIDGYDGQAVTHLALKLAPHVFVRPGELRLAEWSEFDPRERLWTIPAHKTKMRRVHRVPLSRQSMSILTELHKISGDCALLFPSVRSESRAISDNTLNAALRRLGYDKSEMTAHGFRAMASTLLNESGKWHPDAIERQLGHLEKNDVRRAYARGEHWAERVAMMQDWSDWLEAIKAFREREERTEYAWGDDRIDCTLEPAAASHGSTEKAMRDPPKGFFDTGEWRAEARKAATHRLRHASATASVEPHSAGAAGDAVGFAWPHARFSYSFSTSTWLGASQLNGSGSRSKNSRAS